MDNRTIARHLMLRARYLADRDAGLYRVRAYRRAAEIVLGMDEPIERIVNDHGGRGLRELPAIGSHIARTIETLVRTGQLPTVSESTHDTSVKRTRRATTTNAIRRALNGPGNDQCCSPVSAVCSK
jgi:DNA polymerase/3'-5' exonuclease PolX